MKTGVYRHFKSDNWHVVVQDNVIDREGPVHNFSVTSVRGSCRQERAVTTCRMYQ